MLQLVMLSIVDLGLRDLRWCCIQMAIARLRLLFVAIDRRGVSLMASAGAGMCS